MSRQFSPERSGASSDVRERTRRQVREGLEDSGIDSFDALVDRLADVDPRILHEDPVMMIGGIRAEGEPPPPRPHQPPEIPVVLDGETNEPSVVREFDGQELYSTPVGQLVPVAHHALGHPGYRGSRLEIPGGNTRYHLSQYGWNDCTSSTANWGRRF
ncbi:hypothetical protein [Streptomyces canus]|uniref:hypothetical protein n=1 Tax=Streptomyces canus TaxID=58343 RepID=UPI002E2E23DE|nr:hypothetical protein [Streptomyces canus]